MNTERFIAQRIIGGQKETARFSRPVTRIAVLSIILGIVVMILAIGIVTGFRSEIRNKVIGFGSHIRITALNNNNSSGSTPLLIDQDFYPELDTLQGVRHIQTYAHAPGIIETDRNIQGVVIKGVGPDLDRSFFREKLVKGKMLDPGREPENDILVSHFIASRMELDVGDELTVYFVQGYSDIKPRKFTIGGIYDTGMQKFDKRFIFTDIDHIRKTRNWGIEAQLKVNEKARNGSLQIEALAFGGNEEFQYQWPGTLLTGKGPHTLCLKGDSTLSVVISDAAGTLPDTATLHVKSSSSPRSSGECLPHGQLSYEVTTTGGSGKYYTGGFEVLLEDYKDLDRIDRIIYENIPYDLNTHKITEENQDIFSWLNMLDINVMIIIILMIGVASINMTAALLVLILERTNMIGILKAMGAGNWAIRKIFLYHAGYLIGIGLLAGNAIGIGLGLIQQEFGLLTLSEENYYVSEVPVQLKFTHLATLNIGTVILCLLVLILPSYLVTRISPVKAIRFD